MDGDTWVTAAGEFMAQLNGVTVNLAAAAAPTFDTWTPVISDDTTEGGSATADGQYATIGDLVWINLNLVVNDVTGLTSTDQARNQRTTLYGC